MLDMLGTKEIENLLQGIAHIDEMGPRGRRFHTVSCQKYFRIYQFKDLITNRGV